MSKKSLSARIIHILRIIYLILYVVAVLNIIAPIGTEMDFSDFGTGPFELDMMIYGVGLMAGIIFGGVLIYRRLFKKERYKFINNYFVRLAVLFFCGFSFFVFTNLNYFGYHEKWWEIKFYATFIIGIIGGVLVYKHLFPGRKFEKDYEEKKL